jgi:hypothetical protein
MIYLDNHKNMDDFIFGFNNIYKCGLPWIYRIKELLLPYSHNDIIEYENDELTNIINTQFNSMNEIKQNSIFYNNVSSKKGDDDLYATLYNHITFLINMGDDNNNNNSQALYKQLYTIFNHNDITNKCRTIYNSIYIENLLVFIISDTILEIYRYSTETEQKNLDKLNEVSLLDEKDAIRVINDYETDNGLFLNKLSERIFHKVEIDINKPINSYNVRTKVMLYFNNITTSSRFNYIRHNIRLAQLAYIVRRCVYMYYIESGMNTSHDMLQDAINNYENINETILEYIKTSQYSTESMIASYDKININMKHNIFKDYLNQVHLLDTEYKHSIYTRFLFLNSTGVIDNTETLDKIIDSIIEFINIESVDFMVPSNDLTTLYENELHMIPLDYIYMIQLISKDIHIKKIKPIIEVINNDNLEIMSLSRAKNNVKGGGIDKIYSKNTKRNLKKNTKRKYKKNTKRKYKKNTKRKYKKKN